MRNIPTEDIPVVQTDLNSDQSHPQPGVNVTTAGIPGAGSRGDQDLPGSFSWAARQLTLSQAFPLGLQQESSYWLGKPPSWPQCCDIQTDELWFEDFPTQGGYRKFGGRPELWSRDFCCGYGQNTEHRGA